MALKMEKKGENNFKKLRQQKESWVGGTEAKGNVSF